MWHGRDLAMAAGKPIKQQRGTVEFSKNVYAACLRAERCSSPYNKYTSYRIPIPPEIPSQRSVHKKNKVEQTMFSKAALRVLPVVAGRSMAWRITKQDTRLFSTCTPQC
jgi:hypothetical protein